MIRRSVGATLIVLLSLATMGLAAQLPPPSSAAQGGFVQANDLPQDEQLPAAPFVVGAYSFFLVVVLGYAWSIGRRLNRVEQEMRILEDRPARGGGTR